MSSLAPRSVTQDIAKAFAIIAVVYVHVWRGLVKVGLFTVDHPLNFIDNAGMLFAVPLFFALAGYNAFFSLQHTPPREFIIKRAQTIVPIYLVWSLVQEVLRHVQGDAGGSWLNLISILYDAPGQFWFLYALMIYHVVAALLHKRPGIWIAVVVVAYLANPWLPTFPEDTASCGIFYLLGYFYAQRQPLAGKNMHLAISVPVMFVLYAISVAVCTVFGFDLRHYAALIPVLISIGFIMLLSRALELSVARDGLAYIGRASLTIFVLHVIFMAAWRAVMLKLGLHDPYIHFVSGTLVGVAGPLIVYAVLKRMGWLRRAALG